VGLSTICDGSHCGESNKFIQECVKSFFMIGASFSFNIMILNLLIAVFGNEYDRAFSESSQDFMAMKAIFCCKYYFTLSPFRQDDDATRLRKSLHRLQCTWPLFLILGFLFYKSYFAIVAFAVGEILCLVWTRQGNFVDVKENEMKFLWWFHPIDKSDSSEENEDATRGDLVGVARSQDLVSIDEEVSSFVGGLNLKLQTLEREVRFMTDKLNQIAA